MFKKVKVMLFHAHLSEVNIKARYPFYGGSPRLNCTEAYLKQYQTGYCRSLLHEGSINNVDSENK